MSRVDGLVDQLDGADWDVVERVAQQLASEPDPGDLAMSLLEHANAAHPWYRDRLHVAALAAARTRDVAATITGGRFFRLTEDEGVPILVGLFTQHPRPWLTELVTNGEIADWALTRAFVRAGLAPAPSYPWYFTGIVGGIQRHANRDRGALLERVLADPELIESHLIPMLAVEGVGRLLALTDPEWAGPRGERTWSHVFLTLLESGQLDRAEVLAAVVAAPIRGWSRDDVSWFLRLHDQLKPSVDETAQHQSSYLRMLTLEHGPTIKMAQRTLQPLVKSGHADPTALLDASRTVLVRTDKASVLAQLSLLGELTNHHTAAPIVDVLRLALDHPHRDIPARAQALLERLGATARQPATLAFVPPDVVAHTASSVEPVADADELADILRGALEHVEPLAIERAIDGLLRFSDETPATAELLLRRSVDQWCSGRNREDDPRSALVVQLIRLWLDPTRDPWMLDRMGLGLRDYGRAKAPEGTIAAALTRRHIHIGQQVLRRNGTSVALPTKDDGSIDPDTLNRRLAEARPGQLISTIELAIAVLRIHPDDRHAVKAPALGEQASDLIASVAAVPRPIWERRARDITMTRWPIWTNRDHPWIERVPVFASQATSVPTELEGIVARSSPETTLAQELEQSVRAEAISQTFGLAAIVLPHDADTIAAHVHPHLVMDGGEKDSIGIPVIDAIARTSSLIGGPAASALVLALAAKNSRAQLAARDAVIDLARHGRLDGAQLGHQLRLHLDDGIRLVAQRISEGLLEITRADDATVLPVLAALEGALPALPGRRDAAPFIDLAADLSERTGRSITVPDRLAQITGTSGIARATRRLLSSST